MLLVADVGNTNTKIGVFDGDRLLVSWVLTSRREQTADEYGVFIETLLRARGISASDIHGIDLERRAARPTDARVDVRGVFRPGAVRRRAGCEHADAARRGRATRGRRRPLRGRVRGERSVWASGHRRQLRHRDGL